MIIQPPNTNLLINADCLTAMKELPDNSVDSIVTDPPYGLSFMGKKWDYDVPSIEVWKECLRVLKHGGMLLSFAGSRTYHRMAVNIEDAGFEIRDQIMWIYGSGFPKSHNIGKAIDKLQGNERENLGKNPNARKTSGNIQICKKDGSGVLTKGTSDWEGWGTALKPAHEPIVVARKPLSEKTVALNVLKYGTGGINIDACRIEAKDNMGDWDRFKGYQNKNTIRKNMVDKKEDDFKERCDNGINNQGRFPANIIFDEEAGKILDEQTGITKSSDQKWNGENNANIYGKYQQGIRQATYSDKGGASRFFYCAKASKSDRNEGCEELEDKRGGSMDANVSDKMQLGGASLKGEHKEIQPTKNNHPTVKPTKLMQYLVRLVTPKGAVCLDPFMGSGSTGKACVLEGMDFIGIELDESYFEIAKKRINAVKVNTLDNYTESNGVTK